VKSRIRIGRKVRGRAPARAVVFPGSPRSPAGQALRGLVAPGGGPGGMSEHRPESCYPLVGNEEGRRANVRRGRWGCPR
jgi:hypothetical protein